MSTHWKSIQYLAIFSNFPLIICDTLHDLVPIVQFKTREKHPWRSITFSKVAGLELY